MSYTATRCITDHVQHYTPISFKHIMMIAARRIRRLIFIRAGWMHATCKLRLQ